MYVRRENVTTMITQRDRELTEPHPPSTALYTPSRMSPAIPIYSEVQVNTTVPVCRRYVSSPDASHMEYVREHIRSSSLRAPGKPSHRRIPLPSQIESGNPAVVHPLLQPSREEMMMKLDFARGLSSVHVLGHEGCINEAATNPPLPSLAKSTQSFRGQQSFKGRAIESGSRSLMLLRHSGMLYVYATP